MHFSQTEMFDNWKVKKELPSRKRNEMFHTFLKEGIEGKQAWNISISRHNVLSLSPNTLDSDLSRSTSQLAILSCNKKKKEGEKKEKTSTKASLIHRALSLSRGNKRREASVRWYLHSEITKDEGREHDRYVVSENKGSTKW